MLPSHWQQRTALVKDLITSYGCGGRTVVFTDTKNDAAELALVLQDTCVEWRGWWQRSTLADCSQRPAVASSGLSSWQTDDQGFLHSWVT